jgi:hypothetical protein
MIPTIDGTVREQYLSLLGYPKFRSYAAERFARRLLEWLR